MTAVTALASQVWTQLLLAPVTQPVARAAPRTPPTARPRARPGAAGDAVPDAAGHCDPAAVHALDGGARRPEAVRCQRAPAVQPGHGAAARRAGAPCKAPCRPLQAADRVRATWRRPRWRWVRGRPRRGQCLHISWSQSVFRTASYAMGCRGIWHDRQKAQHAHRFSGGHYLCVLMQGRTRRIGSG